MPSIPNIKACVFDAYGTLFDVHSAAGKHRTHLGDEADQVSTLWRTKQLEYTWLRSLMQHHIDFWQITQDALDYARKMLQIQRWMDAFYRAAFQHTQLTVARL